MAVQPGVRAAMALARRVLAGAGVMHTAGVLPSASCVNGMRQFSTARVRIMSGASLPLPAHGFRPSPLSAVYMASARSFLTSLQRRGAAAAAAAPPAAPASHAEEHKHEEGHSTSKEQYWTAWTPAPGMHSVMLHH